MPNIKFLPLNGMDETFKSCYVLEINDAIYIINSGVESPVAEKLGVKKLIPDFNYLYENKERIKAVFIGTPKITNFGSLHILLNKIGKNIPIVTSCLGKTLISLYFQNECRVKNPEEEYNFMVVNSMRDFQIGDLNIVAFKVVNAVPLSFGFVFKIPNNYIVYCDDYILSSDQSKIFQSQVHNLRDILKNQTTLLLITSTGLVEKSKTFTAPFHKSKSFYEGIVSNTSNRIIIAINEDDLFSFFTIANVAKRYQKNLMIYSKYHMSALSTLLKNNMYSNKSLHTLPLSEINNSKTGIVVIAEKPEKIFKKLIRIAKGEDSKITLNETDVFIMGTKLIPGFEGYSAEVLNYFSKLDIRTYLLPKTVLDLKPSNEDHKFLASIVQPKFIIPTTGLYKSFIQYTEVVSHTWIKKNQVILLDNGQFASFNNSETVDTSKRIEIESVPVNNIGETDINKSILYEREQMSTNGIICLSFMLDANKKLISNVLLNDVGVINHDNLQAIEVMHKIKADISNNLYDYFVFRQNNQIDFKETKISLRKAIVRLVDKLLDKKPLVLATIVETKDNANEKTS